jgi:hypothetical protein
MLLKVHYPDRLLRLIAIPIWGVLYRNIGDATPLPQLLQDGQYYLDIGVAILVTFLIWEFNRYVIIRLDQKYSWIEQALNRAIVQAAICFGVSGFLVLMTSFLYNTYLVERHALFNLSVVFLTDIPMAYMFLLVMHLLYTGMWLREYHWRMVEGLQNRIADLEKPNRSLVPERSLRSLLANQGRSQVPLQLSDIAYISVVGELSIIRNREGQSFSIDQTLEQLEEALPKTEFFRLNRQIIAHRQAVRKVESDGTGRLLLHLTPAFSEEVSVSRKKAGVFKAWMMG